jgi:chromosome partitioning protein
MGSEPTVSHVAARREIRELLQELRLPIDERGRRRAEARRIWQQRSKEPLETLDIFADHPPGPTQVAVPPSNAT